MIPNQNGLLVAPGNAKALADAVRLVALDADLQESLRQGAKQSAENELSWDVIAKTLFETF